MGIVDRDKQEKIIAEIEQIFSKYELMPDEKIFVMNSILDRIRNLQQKQKMSDLIGGGLTGGLLKNIKDKLIEEDEGG